MGAVLATPALFIHGAGRAGRAAWPAQHAVERDRPCLWLPRVAPGDPPGRTLAFAAELLDRPAHVVGHSYGGVIALGLAERRPDLVRSLVLVEPAALRLALGSPRTHEHVEALAPVFARAHDSATDDTEFSRLFGEASGIPAPDVPPEVLTAMTRQLRATVPPWTLPVDPTVVARTPTLVVTGSTDTMYAEVADVLQAHGADRVLLDGTGHRPHDDERFAPLLDGFWAAADA